MDQVSFRSQFLSLLAWPLKRAVRHLAGEDQYQHARRTILRESGLGLDWHWLNSLRTVHPIRRDFGWQAGQTIHRYYTEELFLPQYANDIQGHVLEIGDRRYTRRFGRSRVMRSDVLHAKPGNEEATILADLTHAEQIPSNTFDCVVLTFTLQCVYDVKAVIRTLNRILKPRGVLLITAPGISQIARYDDDNWGDYWRFTARSLRMLLSEVFPHDRVIVQPYGNVLAAVAGLHGLISKELRRNELTYRDRDYEVTLTARAVK
jgi:SAM-dependent methyltransferase